MRLQTIIISVLVLICAGSIAHAENRVEFRLAERTPVLELTQMLTPNAREWVWVYSKVELTEDDISDAKVITPYLLPMIKLTFTKDGSEKLARVTHANVGKTLCIFVDDRMVSAPVIEAGVEDGEAVVSGMHTKEQAKRITDRILGREVAPLKKNKLISDLESSDWKKQRAAAFYLHEHQYQDRQTLHALLKALGSASYKAKEDIYWAIRSFTVDLVSELMDVAKSDDSYSVLGALEVMGELGFEADPAVPLLVDLLDSSDRSILLEAARVLVAVSKDPAVPVPHLMKLMDDFDPKLSREAVELIGYLGPSAAPAVPKIVREMGNANVDDLDDYIKALSRIGPAAEEAIPHLIELMGMIAFDVPDSVCNANPKRSSGNIDEMLKQPNFHKCFTQQSRRRSAAVAIGAIHARPDETVPVLLQVIDHGPGYLIHKSWLALAQYGPAAKDAISSLEELQRKSQGKNRGAAKISLACLRGDYSGCVAELIELLEDGDWKIREFAVTKLGELGSKARSALEHLEALQYDPDYFVQDAAIQAIEKINEI